MLSPGGTMCTRMGTRSSQMGPTPRFPEEFEDPDTFDVRRCPPRILSFGAGTHACIGLHVAKMEGRVCIEELLARVPEYELVTERIERIRTEIGGKGRRRENFVIGNAQLLGDDFSYLVFDVIACR